MTDPRGALTVQAGGKSYTLWLGMSVIAGLQGKHGQDVLQRLEPPAGASDAWMPDLNIVVDLFQLALQRYHADADRYVVDEILAENVGALQSMLAAAFPEQSADKGGKASGNAKRPGRAA